MRHSFFPLLLSGFVLVLGSAQCVAAPSPSVWVTVTPVGMNARDFFYLRSERRGPRSHHRYSEMLSLIRCRTSTNEIVESMLLREVEYNSEAADAKWRRVEKPIKPFDLTKYLRDHQVHLPMPHETPKHWKIINNALVDVSEKKPREVLSAAVVTYGKANWDIIGAGVSKPSHPVRIAGAWSAFAPGELILPSGWLLIVQAGSRDGEESFCQNVVFVNGSDYVQE